MGFDLTTGFIVLTPDGGVLGSQEMRDVFDAFQKKVPGAVLAFATAEQLAENMKTALDELRDRVPRPTTMMSDWRRRTRCVRSRVSYPTGRVSCRTKTCSAGSCVFSPHRRMVAVRHHTPCDGNGCNVRPDGTAARCYCFQDHQCCLFRPRAVPLLQPDMSQFATEDTFDSTLALLREGYTFGSARFERHQTNVFQTRVMLRKTIIATGEDAARMFYRPGRFTRKRAMPPNVLMLLQDKGSVQLKDGEAHRHRKQMFMSLMRPGSFDKLGDLFAEEWRARVRAWETEETVALHGGVQEILCRAVCRWAGVPLSEADVERRTTEFAAMIDGAGSAGPRNWRGLLLRMRSERWMRGVIEQVRAGQIDAAEDSALHVIASHRDDQGELLDVEVAAVEMINVLRPTVAVARYVTFAALALHDHPECREPLEAGGEDVITNFTQEVRRFYPFFPFVGGRVREAFEWRGRHFAPGEWLLLDLYNTNHDPRIWKEPHTFQPERFRHWDGSAFNFIPQGGGDHEADHRCPGEWITIDLLKRAVRLLTTSMRYDVPSQDLTVDLTRMPAIPASRFVMSRVRSQS